MVIVSVLLSSCSCARFFFASDGMFALLSIIFINRLSNSKREPSRS